MPGRSLTDVLQLLEAPPHKVVSCVPSYTDSLLSLGLGGVVAGVTDFCPLNTDAETKAIRLGGPRNIRVEEVVQLAPDLVLANFEENTREFVERLESTGILVWVSFPRSVKETLEFLWGIVAIFRSQTASLQVKMIEDEVEWVRHGEGERAKVRYFCPIWQGQTADGEDWWMTFNQDTYPHSVLDLLGGENIFSQRVRHYPLSADLGMQDPEDTGDRDTRYPCVSKAEVIKARPEVIFLPNEPYAFTDDDAHRFCNLFRESPAVQNGKVFLIDGSLTNWYGTRLASALAELPYYLAL
jgi:ABC-type Fe3+-hydroxamate transport system substrate-binding protein